MNRLVNIRTALLFIIFATNSLSSSYNIQLVKDFTKSNDIKIVLLVSCKNELFPIESIVNLQHHGLWTNVWDIATIEEEDVNNFDHRKFFGRYSSSLGVVVNLECNRTKDFMAEMSKRVFFHHEIKWLMMSSGSVEEVFTILNQENINFDAEITVAISSFEHDVYEIYEAYNPSHIRGGRLYLTTVGRWSVDDGWNTTNQTKIERRRDLNGITFPTVVPLAKIPENSTLLEFLNSNEQVHLDSMSRYTYRLFVLMMEMFNFKVNLRSTHLWGKKDSDGTWRGAVGALNRSQVDFCISGLRWADERYGVYEQTTAAYHAQFLFIFRHPKSVDSLNVFLLPFEWTVWLSIFALGIFSSFLVRQLFYFENCKIVKDTISVDEINEESYSNSILMVFGFIFQQGYDGKPFLLSLRVLIMTVLIFSVLIFQFYSSFIVGSLLTEAPKNIKTVKQLLNSRLEFGIDSVPYVLDNFHSASEESTVQLYNKILKNPTKTLMPLQTGLNLLKRGGFVFNTDGSYAYHLLKDILTDSEKCDLQDIVYLPKQPVGPGVTNKSPFRELVKISIRKFSETGILSYNKNVWYGVRPKCEVSRLLVNPIDITHFASALYMLVSGMLTSFIVLWLEIITNRKKSNTKRC